jgi:hypothetical protein
MAWALGCTGCRPGLVAGRLLAGFCLAGELGSGRCERNPATDATLDNTRAFKEIVASLDAAC